MAETRNIVLGWSYLHERLFKEFSQQVYVHATFLHNAGIRVFDIHGIGRIDIRGFCNMKKISLALHCGDGTKQVGGCNLNVSVHLYSSV